MTRRLHIPLVVVQDLTLVKSGHWVTTWTSDQHMVIAGTGETQEKSVEDARYIFKKYIGHPEPGEFASYQVTQ